MNVKLQLWSLCSSTGERSSLVLVRDVGENVPDCRKQFGFDLNVLYLPRSYSDTIIVVISHCEDCLLDFTSCYRVSVTITVRYSITLDTVEIRTRRGTADSVE